MAAEAFDLSRLVFPNSSLNIVSKPDIQCSRLVGYDVDIVGFASMHAVIINGITVRDQIPPLRPAYGRPPVGMTTAPYIFLPQKIIIVFPFPNRLIYMI